jgi:hypothetical protein
MIVTHIIGGTNRRDRLQGKTSIIHYGIGQENY